MKKLFFFAALFAAVSINAQEPVVKMLTEYANYIDFQALSEAIPDMDKIVMNSTTAYTLPNGTVLIGFANSEGKEADCKFKTKASYNTTYFVADGLDAVDSLTVGTQWTAGSGSKMTLGAFKTTADGKIRVFYQLNGDDSKKSGTDVRGISLLMFGEASGEYRFATAKNLCVAAFDLEAGIYEAGDVAFKVLKNTINVCGIQIENLATTDIINPEVAEKAQKMMLNGQLVIVKDGKYFNALGAEMK